MVDFLEHGDAMAERLNLIVEDGVKDMLIELADGERKIGAYVSRLVFDTYEHLRQPRNDVQHNELLRVLNEIRRRVNGLQEVLEEDILTLQGSSTLKLHEAMDKVIREHGPMRTRDIAAEINTRGLYKRGDGSKLESTQVSARANNYPQLFKRLADGRLALVVS